MNPDFVLRVIIVIGGFALKTTVAFGACVALTRLLQAANLRFLVWSAFVYGTGAYWLYLANSLRSFPPQATSAVAGLLQPASSAARSWQLPASWALPLGSTFRVLCMLYLLSLCYLTFCHFRKHQNLRCALSFATQPPSEVEERFKLLARQLHVSRSRLLILSGVTSPVTFGWLRPTILLPPACVEGDPFELEDIMRHELHHVQRWDAIWNGLSLASRGLLFFHPAVRYAVQKMHIERELTCDLAVVSHAPLRRAGYAECLIRFARLNVRPATNSWGLDFAASKNHLSLRIQSILAVHKKSSVWLRSLQIACGVGIAALFVAVVPSLALFVSFSRPFVQNTALSSVNAVPAQALSHAAKARRNVRLLGSSTRVRPIIIEPASHVEVGPTATNLETAPGRTASPSNRSGPQLLHRGDVLGPGVKDATSQIIALGSTDADAKAQERKQILQQTATAALGIYKQLSTADRH